MHIFIVVQENSSAGKGGAIHAARATTAIGKNSQNAIAYSPQDKERKIPTLKLLPAYQLFHRRGNVVLFESTIFKYLRFGNFNQPQLFPFSQVEETNKELVRETVAGDEIMEFFGRPD